MELFKELCLCRFCPISILLLSIICDKVCLIRSSATDYNPLALGQYWQHCAGRHIRGTDWVGSSAPLSPTPGTCVGVVPSVQEAASVMMLSRCLSCLTSVYTRLTSGRTSCKFFIFIAAIKITVTIFVLYQGKSHL